MAEHTSWQQLGKRDIYTSNFMEAYEETVKLPNGTILEDYTTVKFNDIVLVVATDVEGNLVILEEYKYAVDQVMTTIPAGGIEKDEDPTEAGRRELEEETGYTSDEVSYVGKLYEYPTKLSHTLHVVRMKNASKTVETAHEATEQIESISTMSPAEVKDAIRTQRFKTATVLAALVLAMPEIMS